MTVDPRLRQELEKAAEEEKGDRRKGQTAHSDEPYQDQAEARTRRRRVRRRHRARLKAAKLGRSRGGLSSKVHLPADQRCRPLSFLHPRQRNTAERCINPIKEWRGLAFRVDKTPESYLAGLHLRGAILWIRSLEPA